MTVGLRAPARRVVVSTMAWLYHGKPVRARRQVPEGGPRQSPRCGNAVPCRVPTALVGVYTAAMQSPRFFAVMRRCAEFLTVVLFGLWVVMVFARPRHEVAARHYDAVSAACADIAVLPFRHDREVVLCSHLGSVRQDMASFAVLSLATMGCLVVAIRCSRQRNPIQPPSQKPGH